MPNRLKKTANPVLSVIIRKREEKTRKKNLAFFIRTPHERELFNSYFYFLVIPRLKRDGSQAPKSLSNLSSLMCM
jgi:hypothetical protein